MFKMHFGRIQASFPAEGIYNMLEREKEIAANSRRAFHEVCHVVM